MRIWDRIPAQIIFRVEKVLVLQLLDQRQMTKFSLFFHRLPNLGSFGFRLFPLSLAAKPPQQLCRGLEFTGPDVP